MTMKKCFVIQPFDNDIFDKRFDETFKPAIEQANFEAYRVDKDFSVRIPIEEIEKGIADATICFAEITTNNPNVWYELGFAFACGKDVIMICSDEREDKFPFDIQHKSIIRYKTGSRGDFEKLEQDLTHKIKAIHQKAETFKTLSSLPIADTKGLKSNELALLVLIMGNCIGSDESISANKLKSEMLNSGYANIATSLGLLALEKNNMIEIFNEPDTWNREGYYTACRITGKGEQWLFNNQDQLQFRQPPMANQYDHNDFDVPF